MESNKIIIFEDRKIRRIWHNDEWYYSVADIVTVLTDTVNATDYIKKLRKRDDELAKGWGQIVTPLEIETSGGKQGINCANIVSKENYLIETEKQRKLKKGGQHARLGP